MPQPANPIDFLKDKYSISVGEVGARVAVCLDQWLNGLYHLEVATLREVRWLFEGRITINLRGSSLDGPQLLRLIYLANRYSLLVALTPSRRAHDQLGHWEVAFTPGPKQSLPSLLRKLEKEYGK